MRLGSGRATRGWEWGGRGRIGRGGAEHKDEGKKERKKGGKGEGGRGKGKGVRFVKVR